MNISKNKLIAIIVAIISIFILAIGSTLLGLFIPRHGKTRYEIWSIKDTLKQEQIVNLEKQSGKDFKILQLTDIQVGSYNKDCQRAFDTITKLINENKPDLLVLTGDNTQGVFSYSMVNKVVEFIDSFGIKWAPVFGNHDAEIGVDKLYLGEQYLKSKHCLFKFGPSNIKGVGNYVINITENGKVVYSLNMLDSGMWYKNSQKSSAYDYIGYDQMAYMQWYNTQLKTIYNDQTIPSMAFFHIAPVEVLEEYNRLYKEQTGTTEGNQIIKVPQDLGFGEFREPPCPSDLNSGITDFAKTIGMTHFFIGHDHVNTASIKIKDIIMTYGLKVGSSSYNDDDLNGGTLITISSQRNVGIEHKFIK